MPTCFVLGCNSGYSKDRRIRKLCNETRLALFRPPAIMPKETNAERQRRYRQRRKLDFQKEQENKKKDLERYHSKKKMIQTLSARSQRAQRKKWKDKQKQRAKVAITKKINEEEVVEITQATGTPQDLDGLEKWRRAIPRSDKELLLTDRVCELHFPPDDIEKFFETVMPDGSVHKIERDRCKLKEGRVPSIFPSMVNSLTREKRKSKQSVDCSVAPKKIKEEESTLDEMEVPPQIKIVAVSTVPNKSWDATEAPKFITYSKCGISYNPEIRIVEKDLNESCIRHYCCVPGCDSGRIAEKLRIEQEGIKEKIRFRVPKDLELYNKWKKAIPSTRLRKLDSNDTVCELHFREEDIERYWITKIKDGSTAKIERDPITLRHGAVPSIFPNLSTLINPVAKESSTAKNVPVIKTDEAPSRDSLIRDSQLEISDDTQDEYDHFENGKQNTDTNSLQQKENMDVNFHSEFTEENSLQNETVSCENISFSYSILLQNLSQIKKPNAWWSITPGNEVAQFIGCIKWNRQFAIDKRVIIDYDLNVKAFIKEREIVIPDFLQINSVEEVSYLLMKVEYFGICRTALEKLQSNCLVCLTSSGMGRRPLYCSNCTSDRKKEVDRVRKGFGKTSEQKKDIKIKNLRMKHTCVLRRNNRMRLKISNLRMIIEDYKEINSELKKVIKQVSISDSEQDYVQASVETSQNS